MKRKALIVFIVIVFAELCVAGFLVYKNKEREKNALGAISVDPIKKDSLIFPNDNNLKYFYELDPNKTMKDKPEWLSYEATYMLNHDGLNSRFNYTINKPVGTYRIAAIGDSYTFGLYVNTPDNYPSKLEDILNNQKCQNIKKFEVLNLGQGGYDIQYALHRFNLRGQKYNPDLVMWFLKEDDFTLLNEYLMAEVKKIEATMSAAKTPEQQSLPWVIANREMLTGNKQDDIISKEYNFAKDFIENYKGPIFIFTYQETKEHFKNLMIELSKLRKGVYFWDGINYYELSRLIDGHPTASGYSVITNNLFSELTKQNIVPCSR